MQNIMVTWLDDRAFTSTNANEMAELYQAVNQLYIRT